MNKRIKNLLIVSFALFALSSCSNSRDDVVVSSDHIANGQLFSIGSFPTFTDNVASKDTNDTLNVTKESWTAGDIIYLKLDIYDNYTNGTCTGNISKTVLYQLTCNGSSWKTQQWNGSAYTDVSDLTANSENQGVKLTALFAPNYDLNTNSGTNFGNPVLKEGKTPGASEYLTFSKQMLVSELSSSNLISFVRDYTPLRVIAPKGLTINLNSDSFVPAGEKTVATQCTTIADDNNNAYFYGSWDANTTFTVTTTTASGKSYTLPSAAQKFNVTSRSVSNNTVDIDAIPTTSDAVGSGTDTDPYLLSTVDQLKDIMISKNLSQHYKLTQDIDCNQESFYIGGQSDKFTGIFDGAGFTISNLVLGKSGSTFSWSDYVGLFAYIDGGTVVNLTIKKALYKPYSYDYVGDLVGYVKNGKIIKCQSIDGSDIVNNQWNTTNNPCTGGLIGRADNSLVLGCYSNITVQVNPSDGTGLINDGYCGGLIGFAYGSTIIDGCYSEGNVYAKCNKGRVGGFIGGVQNSCRVASCFSTGQVVNCNTQIRGAFIGEIYTSDCAIECCATLKGIAPNFYADNSVAFAAHLTTITSCSNNCDSYKEILAYVASGAARSLASYQTTGVQSYLSGHDFADSWWVMTADKKLKLWWK